MTYVESARRSPQAPSLADMAYEILKTAARPMPVPVLGNRIRITYGVPTLTEAALMEAVSTDPRFKRYGSGHLMLSEWDGRLV